MLVFSIGFFYYLYPVDFEQVQIGWLWNISIKSNVLTHICHGAHETRRHFRALSSLKPGLQVIGSASFILGLTRITNPGDDGGASGLVARVIGSCG